MAKSILIAGGILNFILAILHAMFWQMFNWPDSISSISLENQAVLQIATLITIFVLLYFSVMSFVLPSTGVRDFASKSIIWLISGFYFIRLVTGYPFFGYSHEELIIWIVSALIIGGYLSTIFIFKYREPRLQ